MISSKNSKPSKTIAQPIYSKSGQINTTNFDFLMQSIDRDKFINQVDKENCHNNQGRYSYKSKSIKLQQSYMTKSTLVNSYINKKQVKEKQFANFEQLIQSLIYKVKKYLSITQLMLHNPAKVQDKLRKQGINAACELLEITTNVEEINPFRKYKDENSYSSLNSTGNLVIGSNKSMSSSQHFSNALSNSIEGSANFMRKIENLQQQKMQLQNKISQHQLANIKMFIQLNEGQSQEIQKYKKLLSSLYEKYKQLQKLVKKECEKSRNLQLRLDQSKSAEGCGKLCELNTKQLRKKIQNSEEIILEQNQCLARALSQMQTFKSKCEKYRMKQMELINKISELQKSEKKRGINSRLSPMKTCVQKSICNDVIIDTEINKNLYKSMTSDSTDHFANISLKLNSSAKVDEDLLRIILVQASVIDSALKK